MNPPKTSASRAALASAGLALTIGLGGCAKDNLPDYIQLGSLRVLALKADHPEVAPGASVTITPVVSDFALGRALTYSALGCVDPGVGYGAKPSCDGVPGAATLVPVGTAVGTIDSGKFTHTGAAPQFTVTVPSTILANRSAIDQFNGVAYLVVYTLTATSSDGTASQVVSYKRIIASADAAAGLSHLASGALRNSNPALSGISAAPRTGGAQALSALVQGLSFPLADTSEIPLSPAFGAGTADAAEAYTLVGTDGTVRGLTETLTTTWFISDGSMAFYRTNGTDSDAWTPPSAQPKTAAGDSRGVFFVVVTRDGRGGESFQIAE
jgi:hypothetical protein